LRVGIVHLETVQEFLALLAKLEDLTENRILAVVIALARISKPRCRVPLDFNARLAAS